MTETKVKTDINGGNDGVTPEDFTKARVDSEVKKQKKETRGRPKKIDVEKQKEVEREKAREFGKAILPTALESVEFMFLSRVPDETLRENLKLKDVEKVSWSEAFIAVAEKHGWLNPSDMPELTLIVVTAGIILPRIEIIRNYASAKKRNKISKADKQTDDTAKDAKPTKN